MNKKKKCKWQLEDPHWKFTCESPDDDFDGLCSPENCNESIFTQIRVFGFKCILSWLLYCFSERWKYRLNLGDYKREK